MAEKHLGGSAPCKGCADRYPACSDHCRKPEFLAWRTEQERIRQAKSQGSSVTDYQITQILKNRRVR